MACTGLIFETVTHILCTDFTVSNLHLLASAKHSKHQCYFWQQQPSAGEFGCFIGYTKVHAIWFAAMCVNQVSTVF